MLPSRPDPAEAADAGRPVPVLLHVTNSTELAHQLSLQVFVDKLNRLLAAVIAATESHHGLVNKFEGDAARQIRDRVLADVGNSTSGSDSLPAPSSPETSAPTSAWNTPSSATRSTRHHASQTLAKHTPGWILAADTVIRAASEHERE